MSIWILIVAATAFGGALLLWNTVSRTKHVSEEMLSKYHEMLVNAREERARQLLESEEDGSDEPIATEAAEG